MARMLGKETRLHRQRGLWWFCCEAHDGKWKGYIRLNRRSQRAREKRDWKKEITGG
jgi:hypothetical protein